VFEKPSNINLCLVETLNAFIHLKNKLPVLGVDGGGDKPCFGLVAGAEE